MKRTFEEVKKGLESYISNDTARAEAWKKVILNKKKNGEDFAQIGRSFTNATVGDYYPVEDWFNPYLTVSYEYINENGRREYATDHMEIYTETYAEHREKRQSPYSSAYFHYMLTPNEIMEKISKRIELFESSAEQHKRELASAEMIYNKYIPQIKSIMKSMKLEANSLTDEETTYNTSLYYMLKESAESAVSSAY